jgi:formylglycine-generating enzyme required for sulfatase activity
MLIQRAGTGTIPPSVGGFATPCWESLAEVWNATPDPSSATVTVGPATVELGHNDFEAEDDSLDVKDHEFGWDNEHPKHKVDVSEFRIEWRPVTNGQFYEYWKAAEGKVPMPKSWVMQNGNVMVSHLPKRFLLLWVVAYALFCERLGPHSLWTGSDENCAAVACHGRLQQFLELCNRSRWAPPNGSRTPSLLRKV